MEDRKTYDELFELDPLLWQKIAEFSPQEVCSRCWIEYEKKQGYRFFFLDRECIIDPLNRTISFSEKQASHQATFQEALVILTYLVRASPIAPLGRMVTEKELKGGELFFRGPHALLTRPLIKHYGNRPDEFMKAGEALGGVAQEYGDAAFKVRPLPKIPIGYILYQGDEEFDAHIVITFDYSIQDHLPLDVIWALVNITSIKLLKYKS